MNPLPHNQDGKDQHSLLPLLTLKHHELPPPGYFSSFSSKVIARIEANTNAAQLSFWQKLQLAFSTKPSLASGLGLIVGASLVASLNFAPILQSNQLEENLLLGNATWLTPSDWNSPQPAPPHANPLTPRLVATTSSFSPIPAASIQSLDRSPAHNLNSQPTAEFIRATFHP
jgi:hypothetical protein